jgi:transposase
VFYNRPESIANSFLNKVINYSILRFNLSLPEYYLSSKSRFKRASLKQLKKRLSKRLLRLRKKSSSRLRRTTKLKSLTCGYNESDV